MPVNKTEAEHDIKYSTDIGSSYRIVGISPTEDITIPIGDLTGVNPNNGLLYYIYQQLQASYTDVVIAADDNEYVNLGLKTAYRRIKIEYIAERGSLVRGGIIEVLNDGTYAYANDAYQNSDENNYDWLKCADSVILGSQIQIQLIADDTDGNNTTFKYRIVERIPVVT